MTESNLPFPLDSLRHQVVLVTGGATGIGLGIAQAFAAAGSKVAIGSRRAEVVEQALREFPGQLENRFGQSLDVTDRDSVTNFVAEVQTRLGPIDILVNAAGVNIKTRSMAEMTPDQWDQVMAINATGAYNLIHAVLPGMRERGSGLIVNVSSVAGKRAIALGGVAYSASKFAMTALGTCVANEVGAEGVRVTNIYPGEVDTPILDHRPVPLSQEHRDRILKPSDVGHVVVSLAALPPRVHIPELVIKPVQQPYY
ncbi:MAG: SDR family oxidoreductase [Planctomycetota bacterium]|jgi:NADP-dependent 3-hydroxy acid dehydrogenase YdfG